MFSQRAPCQTKMATCEMEATLPPPPFPSNRLWLRAALFWFARLIVWVCRSKCHRSWRTTGCSDPFLCCHNTDTDTNTNRLLNSFTIFLLFFHLVIQKSYMLYLWEYSPFRFTDAVSVDYSKVSSHLTTVFSLCRLLSAAGVSLRRVAVRRVVWRRLVLLFRLCALSLIPDHQINLSPHRLPS